MLMKVDCSGTNYCPVEIQQSVDYNSINLIHASYTRHFFLQNHIIVDDLKVLLFANFSIVYRHDGNFCPCSTHSIFVALFHLKMYFNVYFFFHNCEQSNAPQILLSQTFKTVELAFKLD